ncbi:hypothetical protein D3C72_2001560 [compost metagenome]
MLDIITIMDLGIHTDIIRRGIISIIKKNTRGIIRDTVNIEGDINCWAIIVLWSPFLISFQYPIGLLYWLIITLRPNDFYKSLLKYDL